MQEVVQVMGTDGYNYMPPLLDLVGLFFLNHNLCISNLNLPPQTNGDNTYNLRYVTPNSSVNVMLANQHHSGLLISPLPLPHHDGLVASLERRPF